MGKTEIMRDHVLERGLLPDIRAIVEIANWTSQQELRSAITHSCIQGLQFISSEGQHFDYLFQLVIYTKIISKFIFIQQTFPITFLLVIYT